MEGGFLDLDAFATGVAQSEKFLVHRHGHVPEDLSVILVFGRVEVEEEAMTWEQHVPKRTGLEVLAWASRQIFA